MLHIHIGSITEQGLDLDQQVDAVTLPLLDAVTREGSIRFTRPMHVSIRATLAGQTVLIDGTIIARVRIPCSRCLEPFDLTIETDFSATAVPEIPANLDPDAADDIELSADEIEAIAYRGNSIDLRDEIAQQVIMALPFKPLCRDTCKGLCGRCGVDLNKTPCQCPSKDQSSPFAVLKTLSFPKEKE